MDTATSAKASPDTPEILRITVVNGDLTFEGEALLLGHYHATRLTGTEKVMDRLLGGTMERSLGMGVYPLAVGSHQIFINNRPNVERGTFTPRPKAVIVVGLGEEGKLRAADLVQSVRQAVIGWAQRLDESERQASGTFELASTLLGSGGTGVSPGEAARLIAEGVYRANMRFAEQDEDDPAPATVSPRVTHLRFIELYLDRATDAWRSLRLQAAARPGRYVIDDVVESGTGGLQRPEDLGYRGAEFDFISVASTTDADGNPVIAYTLDTRRARSEVRAQRAQSLLIKELVETASNDQNDDQQIGRTLFDLLIPIELEAYLAGSGEMQIELDPQTAAIPWELLDTTRAANEDLPWALRVNLLRKLRITRFRERVVDAGADGSALVIGEPETPPAFSRLPGARAEAESVRIALTGPRGLRDETVRALIAEGPNEPGPGARDVVNALFERPWRVVHIAGHGVPGEDGKAGGVALSNGTFLGPAEIGSMRTVPELVFMNCCHLGAADAGELLKTYDRAEFASGVAGELIALGVRCVIAAGWAVDDDGATVFADTFYRSLLAGNRFITAVGQARMAAYRHAPDQNTWAAYQCYGDPDWVFRQAPPDANRPSVRVSDDFSGIASAASLKVSLERMVVGLRFQGADRAAKLDSLRTLESTYGEWWGHQGDVAELLGEAFAEAGDVDTGVRWYRAALAAPDGHASMRAAEQLGHIQGRLGWEIVDEAARRLAEVQDAAADDDRTRKKPRKATADAERALAEAIARADVLIADAMTLLEKLTALQRTSVRTHLIGSTHKFRALVNGAAGRRDHADRDLELMASSYREALEADEQTDDDIDLFTVNALVADVALNAGRQGWRGVSKAHAAAVERSLKKSEPSFVTAAGIIQLDQFQAIAKGRLADALPELEKAYDDLFGLVGSARLWASVYDTASLVLPSYAARANAEEKAAADALLTRLRGFAHPPKG